MLEGYFIDNLLLSFEIIELRFSMDLLSSSESSMSEEDVCESIEPSSC